MTSFGVTLLSGGLDSTTVTAYAKDSVDKLTAITFRYGQTHSKEIEYANLIARKMNIAQKVIDISFLKDVAWYSALTNPHLFPIPENRPKDSIGFSIPITYVPLRNTIFLSLATALLESEILSAIEENGLSPNETKALIYMAPNIVDYSGYPDCRPDFFDKIRGALKSGSKIWTQYAIDINIETPIINLSKSEIALMGIKLKAPLEYTWSCYEGQDLPCKTCDSCILRAKGFQEAGITDPYLVRIGKHR